VRTVGADELLEVRDQHGGQTLHAWTVGWSTGAVNLSTFLTPDARVNGVAAGGARRQAPPLSLRATAVGEVEELQDLGSSSAIRMRAGGGAGPWIGVEHTAHTASKIVGNRRRR
jgi:hypothetical protein